MLNTFCSDLQRSMLRHILLRLILSHYGRSNSKNRLVRSCIEVIYDDDIIVFFSLIEGNDKDGTYEATHVRIFAASRITKTFGNEKTGIRQIPVFSFYMAVPKPVNRAIEHPC